MSDPFAGLPLMHFGAILADPPWSFATWSDKGRDRSTDKHYPSMEIGHIAALPVRELAAKDCALFLWVTWPQMPAGLEVMKSWGFAYKTCAFSWLKSNDDGTIFTGCGYWTRANTEVCLLGTRGKPKRLNADVKQGIIAPRREHGRKPDAVHGRIERLVDGPYLELFARSERRGWTSWGNEPTKFGSAA